MALLFPPWAHFDNAEMPIGSQMATQSAPLMASQAALLAAAKKDVNLAVIEAGYAKT